MPHQPEYLIQTRTVLAALFASLVKALDEPHPSVSKAFQENLDRLYRDERDNGRAQIPLLETLKWTGDLIRRLES
jgi:hypothetical protein